MKRYNMIRPGSIVSKIVDILFHRTVTPDQLEYMIQVTHNTLLVSMNRAIRYNLIVQHPLSLTPQGRLYHIANTLNISMLELVAVSSIYAQLDAWDNSTLRYYATKKFAIKDHTIFRPYKVKSPRLIYGKLLSKGMIHKVGRQNLVSIDDTTLRQLLLYHDDLLSLYKNLH